MVPLRVGVLGPVTAWRDECEIDAGQPRQLAVLGVLATRANRLVSRGELVDAVWGEQPPATAEGGIYTYVAGLRRVLEPDRPQRAPARVLVSQGGGYMLRLGPGSLDSGCFEECLGRARYLRATDDPAAAERAVAEALALWRGLAFAGVPGPFAEAERQRLGELRTTAAVDRADLLLALGRAAEAVPDLTALVAEHPLREQASGLLMIALYRCGRQAEALRVFRDARERLAEDLGIDPGDELTNIHRQLLAMDPALAGRAGPGEVTLLVPPPAGPAQVPPAQVPPETAGFAGRLAELRRLHAMLPAEEQPAGDPPVVVVTGTAGVGKTTLAIRFARQVAPRFPDGQLYVNLRGFDPSGAPTEPAAALGAFFEALGVPPRQVPASLDAQTGLFRSLLAGRRMLLLLDNARSTEQVRPLFPGSPGCMVVITSRSQLTGLVAAEGARSLPLDVLSEEEAGELLTGRLGRDRVATELDAVAELIGQCDGLPLALSVICARAVTRPVAALADLAAELRDTRGRLDALETGDVITDLRAVFSWSYCKLSPPAARMFRLLGIHPGPDISAAAAASLAGLSAGQARGALAELTRASLLTEGPAGRFGCHELLRAYAAEQAEAGESEAGRAAARRRVVDYYVRTARAASRRLYPAHGHVEVPMALPDVSAQEFASYEGALAWFGAEHRVLNAVLAMAAGSDLDRYCWTLAWYWSPILKRRGYLREVEALMRTALTCAQRLGDPVSLAHVHYDLGHASVRLGDFAACHEHMNQALDLFTQLGDGANIGQVQHGLAMLFDRQGRYAEALEHATEALRLRRAFAEPAVVAYSENAVGWIYAHLGRHEQALRHCRRGLKLHRDSGSRSGAADTLDSMGYAYGGLADYDQAIAHYEQAVDIYREIGDTEDESESLIRLGDAQLAAGLPGRAGRSWERALTLLCSMPGVDTREVRARLGRLTPVPGQDAEAVMPA